jgi:hypothetical protein
MPLFRSKRVRNRAILIQVLFIAGLIVLYKFGLPGVKRMRARAAAEDREQAIMSFFQSITIEVGGSGNQAAGDRQGGVAKRLRETPEVEEVEQQLGAPGQTMVGYGGAQHLTWIGTRHKLQASFNKGQLYALTLTDLKTGHGEQVYKTSAHWRAF